MGLGLAAGDYRPNSAYSGQWQALFSGDQFLGIAPKTRQRGWAAPSTDGGQGSWERLSIKSPSWSGNQSGMWCSPDSAGSDPLILFP